MSAADLKVGLALLSLDSAGAFLGELGFEPTDAAALRSPAREILESQMASAIGPDALIQQISERIGQVATQRIVELAKAVDRPQPSVTRAAWLELFVRLEAASEPASGISHDIIARFMSAARAYVNDLDHLSARLEGLSHPTSDWDAWLLKQSFFRQRSNEEAATFDAAAWLYPTLAEQAWQDFAATIQRDLSEEELSSLVSWGQSRVSPALRTRLSNTLS